MKPRVSLQRAGDGANSTFRADLARCFERAVGRRGLHERRTELAGHGVRLEFAGPALGDTLTEFLTNTGGRREPVELSLKFWDTETTGIEPPAPPSLKQLSSNVRSRRDGGLDVAFCAVSSTLQAYSPEHRCGHYWVRRPHAVPGWEAAAPFRSLLAWWAGSFGGVLAHAAVVGTPEHGVLLAGASGAGKSTSALACVAAGLGFLGDDCALLTLEEGQLVAHSIYRTAKVDPRLLDGPLGPLRHFASRLVHDRGKVILALPRGHAGLLVRARIGAVVTQSVAGHAHTRLEPASPARLLRALAPSTLLQSPGIGQQAFDLMAKMVIGLPCYSVSAGSDLAALGARLSELAH